MKAHVFFLVLVLFGASMEEDAGTCSKSSKQVHSRLKHNLLCDYDKSVRPRINHKNSTKVTIKMIVQSLTYDIHSNMLTVNSWIPTTWEDEHLQWNPSDYEDLKFTHLSSNEIWTPDLSIINRYQENGVQRLFNSDSDCIISYMGEINCVPPAKYDALCVPDLRKYPFDKQECGVWMSSWVHTGEVIDFNFAKRTPISTDNVENNEWTLLNASTTKHPGVYKCCPNETYPVIGFIFNLERKASYHVTIIIAPALAIAITTLLVLCIDATGNERLHLLLGNILLHFLFVEELSLQLPNAGDKLPTIVIFARNSLILCLIEFIITIILQHFMKAPSTAQSWTTRIADTIIDSKVGQVILIFDTSLNTMGVLKDAGDGANLIEEPQEYNIKKIMIAKLIDRLLFFLFIITYIVMFVNMMP